MPDDRHSSPSPANPRAAPVISDAPTSNSSRNRFPKAAARVAGLLAGLVISGWAGLQFQPDTFPAPDVETPSLRTIPLPPGLPLPVERFYRAVYGDHIPIIEGMMVSGRGTMRISGITLPVRFRFIHEAGEAYRHHIEATWFGYTFLSVDERFFDGEAVLDLPFGTSSGPQIDQGANLTMWAETIWMPSVWLNDARVRWGPLDEQIATLIVPFGDDQQSITVRFDPKTHLITHMESMRYQNEDSSELTLWTNAIEQWAMLDGFMLPTETAVSWSTDEPWAVLTTDSVIYSAGPGIIVKTSEEGQHKTGHSMLCPVT